MPRLDGVEHRYVDAAGLRVHVAELGDPAAPPLVLLHGWPQHWYCWRLVAPLLARDHRVLMPDLRGFGWTDAPTRGYGKHQLARDVLAALDALDVDRFALVGHDWGSMVGFRACLDAPDRIASFVSMNGGHPWMRPGPLDSLNGVARMLPYQGGIAAPLLGSAFVRHVMLPATDRLMRRAGSWDEAAATTYRAQFDEPERVEASVQLYRTWLTRELPALRATVGRRRLRVPTLLLHGAHDPVLRPGLVSSGVDRMANLRFELVPRAGHFVQEDQPEVVASRILGHVAAHAARGAD
ncbi:MAG: alpha/beta hydrolase fold protein [Thermoleophilia bacterium]|nr:alpha/beta hydrolase fold protein [Thermoleophilia bacterium]